jgi:TfoX/Sxy family transcriptional regulator of competence genes
MTGNTASLEERLRSALDGNLPVREVAMFGGRSFMVREKIVAAVLGEGALLVRVDPGRHEELLAAPGASPAEMGAGRAMGAGWISVCAHALATQGELDFWLGAAMEHNARIARSPW